MLVVLLACAAHGAQIPGPKPAGALQGGDADLAEVVRSVPYPVDNALEGRPVAKHPVRAQGKAKPAPAANVAREEERHVKLHSKSPREQIETIATALSTVRPAVETANLVPPTFANGLRGASGVPATTAVALLETGVPREVPGPVRCPIFVEKHVFEEGYRAAQVAQAAYDIGVLVNGLRPNSDLKAGDQNLQVVYTEEPGVQTKFFGSWSGPGMVAMNDERLYVVYRGTNSLADALTDAMFNMVKYEIGNEHFGYVHRGFHMIWSRSNLTTEAIRLAGDRQVFFTGHSLGGALAQLAALEYAALTGKIPWVYTFGSPRVGEATWRSAFRRSCFHYRFKHDHDVVPEVPLTGNVINDGLLANIKPRWYTHASDVAVRLLETPTEYQCINEFGPIGFDGIDDHRMEHYKALIAAIMAPATGTTPGTGATAAGAGAPLGNRPAPTAPGAR
jgi:hypothetical protein